MNTTSAAPGLRRLAKGQRLKGEEAAQFAEAVVKAYETASISQICAATGRSYGALHGLLKRRGVPMRPRGGQRSAPATAADPS